MNHKKWLMMGAVVAALFSAPFLAPQQQAFADGQAMLLPVDPVPLLVETVGGKRSFDIEIADEAAERSAGLMFRDTMPDNRGMLFIFRQTQDAAFWMKNTPMPLDLIFVGQDGRIRAILRGEPQSEALVTAGEPVRFVLELKAGTAAREGIRRGDLLKHPAIDSARSE